MSDQNLSTDEIIANRLRAEDGSVNLRKRLVDAAGIYQEWADRLTKFAKMESDPGFRGPQPKLPPSHQDLERLVEEYFIQVQDLQKFTRLLQQRTHPERR